MTLEECSFSLAERWERVGIVKGEMMKVPEVQNSLI